MQQKSNLNHRKLSGIEKSGLVVCVRALITRQILRSKDAHSKTEESPKTNRFVVGL